VAFVLYAVLMVVCYEVGFRIGRWWQDRLPGEQEGPTDRLVGSLLALIAFLLAVTMGMAADRFDTRRANVLASANAIGAAYLQDGYLTEPQAEALRQLLREYLPLRIAVTGTDRCKANLAASQALQPKMWAIVQAAARSGHSPDLMSSLGGAVSDVVTTSQTRETASLYARVPDTLLVALLGGSALSLLMVGSSAGLKRRRSLLSATVLILVTGIVLTILVDLDRPREGFLVVSQQPLLDVQAWIGAPASG
jgi:hypothetical protein